MGPRPDARAQLGVLDASFFPQLATGGFLRDLARLQRATGRDPHVAFAHVCAEQQDALLLVDEPHAGRGPKHRGVVSHRQHSSPTEQTL